MARAGEMIENPVTGQRLIFLVTSTDSDGELLSAEGVFPPGGFAGVTHIHPHQDEHFEVLDGEAVGGQAGASARIENYLGFPTGISGQALTGRALNQAQKFGAEVAIPLVATRLLCTDPRADCEASVELTQSDQGSVRARTVVVASGMSSPGSDGSSA